jgi:phosphopantothenoylcysteine decarboxylase
MATYNPSANPKPSPKPLTHAPHFPHLLLAATGSVATIKIPSIISELSKYPISIRLILTPSSTQFLAGQSAEQPTLASIATLPHVDGIYTDEDEWTEPWVRGNKILHIELRRWADLCVVAPLSADALARVAGGLSDGLVFCTIRAWDTTGLVDPVRYGRRREKKVLEVLGRHEAQMVDSAETNDADGNRNGEAELVPAGKKHIIVAPAMNTAMWVHPITQKHIKLLEEDWGVKNGGWFEVLRPMEKELACGDTGIGAMKDWREIVGVIEDRLDLKTGDMEQEVS